MPLFPTLLDSKTGMSPPSVCLNIRYSDKQIKFPELDHGGVESSKWCGVWCNARFKHGPQILFRGWAGGPIGWALARPSGISPGGGGWVFLVIQKPGSDLEPNGSLPGALGELETTDPPMPYAQVMRLPQAIRTKRNSDSLLRSFIDA